MCNTHTDRRECARCSSNLAVNRRRAGEKRAPSARAGNAREAFERHAGVYGKGVTRTGRAYRGEGCATPKGFECPALASNGGGGGGNSLEVTSPRDFPTTENIAVTVITGVSSMAKGGKG